MNRESNRENEEIMMLGEDATDGKFTINFFVQVEEQPSGDAKTLYKRYFYGNGVLCIIRYNINTFARIGKDHLS